jgi:hypothetical protein
MTHVCGCQSCKERDALTLAEMAEHQADFDRWLAKRQDRLSGFPRLEGDHETQALAETHWKQTIAVPAVRRIG